MDITRQNAIDITNEINEAIAAIALKRGLTFKLGRTTYGPEFNVKITAFTNETNESGFNVNSPEVKAFLHNAHSHGITNPETALATPVVVKGEEYQIVGYKPRATKRPFIMKKISNGKSYIFPDGAARHMATYDYKKDFMSDSARIKRNSDAELSV
jgi:hypothetical protein